MARYRSLTWHLLLVGLLFSPCLHLTGPVVVSAQEDGVDDEVMGEGESVTMGGGDEDEEEEDMEVEDEEDDEPVRPPDVGDTAVSDEEDDEGAVEEEEEEEEEEEYAPHPDCQSAVLFTKRPNEELSLNILQENNEYRDAVFNNTVNIVEVEESFDAETFFMYLFMVSGLLLLALIIHFVYKTVRRGGRSAARRPVETGTQDKDGVDYQWVPDGALPNAKKSPRPSPRPRKGNKK